MPKRVKKISKPIKFKKTTLTRKTKLKTIEIVSRKEQPVFKIKARVPALQKQDIAGMVASSWISALRYDSNLKTVRMELLDGNIYIYYEVPFSVFERWYYAHSKGTFHNLYIRGNYRYDHISALKRYVS